MIKGKYKKRAPPGSGKGQLKKDSFGGSIDGGGERREKEKRGKKNKSKAREVRCRKRALESRALHARQE